VSSLHSKMQSIATQPVLGSVKSALQLASPVHLPFNNQYSQLAAQQQRLYSTRSHSLQSRINGHARQLFLLSSRFQELPPKVLIVIVSHLYELTVFR